MFILLVVVKISSRVEDVEVKIIETIHVTWHFKWLLFKSTHKHCWHVVLCCCLWVVSLTRKRLISRNLLCSHELKV